MSVDVDSNEESGDLTECPPVKFKYSAEEEDDFISMLHDIGMLKEEHPEAKEQSSKEEVKAKQIWHLIKGINFLQKSAGVKQLGWQRSSL